MGQETSSNNLRASQTISNETGSLLDSKFERESIPESRKKVAGSVS